MRVPGLIIFFMSSFLWANDSVSNSVSNSVPNIEERFASSALEINQGLENVKYVPIAWPTLNTQNGLPNAAQSHIQKSKMLSYLRLGLLITSMGVGAYSASKYNQAGNSNPTQPKQNNHNNDQANMALNISGVFLVAGLISFSF